MPSAAPLREVRAVILGCAQDGGIPQAGCGCTRCTYARVTPEYSDGRVACLGLIDEIDRTAFLIDATPDITVQLWDLQRQSGSSEGLQLGGILLTHAHTGHYIGLLQLGKEGADARGVPVFCTESMAAFLQENLPWRLLVERGNIDLRIITPAVEFKLSSDISITAVSVPHRSEISDTVAYVVAVGPARRQKLLYCPDTDTWEDWDADVSDLCGSLDVAILDGTFYNTDELPGRDIREVPHPMAQDTIKLLSGSAAQLVLTHFNHTNPLAMPGSRERAQATTDGAQVATVGMNWAWPCGDEKNISAQERPRGQPAEIGAAAAAAEAAAGGGSGGSSSKDGASAAAATAAAAAASAMPVVDWDLALEQCSGDETFLYELLGDLWSEASENLDQLNVHVAAGEAELGGRIAHSIKGAAANLMCLPLRGAALAMERVGIAAANNELQGAELQDELQAAFGDLRHEMDRFGAFLRAQGVAI